MIIKVEISEETWVRMLTGRRLEGTIGLETVLEYLDEDRLEARKALVRRELEEIEFC